MLLFPSILNAQKVFKIAVIEEKTHYPIPYTAIALIKQNLAVNTDEDGLFDLDEEVIKSGDTLLVTSQGFLPEKLPVRFFEENRVVEMKADTLKNTLFLVAGNKNQNLWLNNDFNPQKLGAFAGPAKVEDSFDYLQLAQKFELPEANAMLKRVKVARLIQYIDPQSSVVLPNSRVAPERTKFLLRIYDVDSLTGMPGKDLCDSLIEIKNNERKIIRINVTNLKIKIPGKAFFVGVQLLRLPFNVCYVELPSSPKSSFTSSYSCFKPSIAISDVKHDKLNTYVLNFRNEWHPYTYFAPDYTDFAISAQVEY